MTDQFMFESDTDEASDEVAPSEDGADELASSRQAEFAVMLRQVTRERLAERSRLPIGTPWRDSINPVLRDVGALIAEMTTEVSQRAVNRLHELLGGLAEHKHVRARTATVFLRVGDGRLQAVATANLLRTTLEISESDRGIVPWVARSGQARFVPDVDKEPDYFADLEDTRSELAVPLVLPNGVVVGVVNLESDLLDHFGPSALRAVERVAGDLIVELLVLWELATGGETRLPWHPEKQGWDLQELMTQVCHRICQTLNRDCVKAAISYVDLENDEASLYATSGAGYRLRTRRFPKFRRSGLRQALRAPVGEVVDYNPAADLATAQLTLQVEEGWLINIHSAQEARQKSHGQAALMVFVAAENRDDELVKMSRRLNVREALPELAKLLRNWFAAFAALRPLMANARLNSQIHPLRKRRGKFDALLQTALATLPASAGTVFAVPQGSQKLVCVATTGLVKMWDSGEIEKDISYDLVVDVNQWTVNVAHQYGEPVRINRVRGTSQSVRSRPERERGPKWREILPGENSDNRRLLAVGIADGEEILGVLRVVRTLNQKPFTLCDGHLVRGLAQLGAEIVMAWREDLEEIPASDGLRGCKALGLQRVEAIHSAR